MKATNWGRSHRREEAQDLEFSEIRLSMNGDESGMGLPLW